MDILGGIHHCVTYFCEFIFYSHDPLALPLNHKDIGGCCTDNEKPKVRNSYKIVWQYVKLFPTEKNKFFVHN